MMLSERIKAICKEKGTSVYRIEKQLGFGNGSIGKWGKDGRTPSYDRLAAVAKLLGVTVSELTGEKEKSPTSGEIGPSKQDLLNLIDTMEMSELAEIIQMAAETIQKRLK